MRQYIDIVARYIAETIISTLEVVPLHDNISREIGSAGHTVTAGMTDMLPHHGVADRNKPQAFADVFAKLGQTKHNDDFSFETPPAHKTIEKRRNNDAGIDKLKGVSPKGDASATLHHDYAGRAPNAKSIMPRNVHKKGRTI